MQSTCLNKEKEKEFQFSHVVAFDVGTSRSGYGYADAKDPTEIISEQNWSGEGASLKTRTDILLKPNGEVHTFGKGFLCSIFLLCIFPH